MNLKSIVALGFYLATLSLPVTALATTGRVTIDFGGLCNPITIDQPPPFYLFAATGSFTCSSGGTNYFKIEDNGANRAHIAPTSSAGQPGSTGYLNDTDGTNDTLRVKDWKITALTPTPANLPGGYQVSIWLQFDTPPVTDGPGPQQNTYYKTTLYGSIQNNPGNWAKMDPGYITNPIGAAETTLGTSKTFNVPCVATPCTPAMSSFPTTFSTSGLWPDAPNYLSGPRILRTKFSFRLNAVSDVLLISTTGGKINAQTNADPGEQDECSEQYTQCPSCWDTIFSTFKWTTLKFSAEPSQSAKLDMFAKVNWASLQQDMARGNGEYLASLATLLEVPIEKQTDFFILAQDQYRAQAEEGVVKRVDMLSRLQEAIASRPMLVAGTMELTP